MMLRISGLSVRPELRGLAAYASGAKARKRGLSGGHQQPAGTGQRTGQRTGQWLRKWPGSGPLTPASERKICRRRVVFAGERTRMFSSVPGGTGDPPGAPPGEPPGEPDRQPRVSVVGIPDPLTWIRCKVITYLTDLYFETDINSMEFDRGVKQALVHVSNKMSRGRYHELKGVVSNEMMEYVEERCRPLSDAQRRQLAVNMDDIIFVLPEDVSVVFDEFGRKFCFVVMRFWLLSTHDGPDDPEGSRIFKVTPREDDGPQKKVATAVYEFHRELTMGAPPDWTVTTVWHWHWKLGQ
ncbi:m-AAA protease-interacting protein 1, mitochondrial [Menidia menidia]